MPDRQFEGPLISTNIDNPRVLPIWIIPKDYPQKSISHEEEKWANKLPREKAKEYKHSRGYTRHALSNLFHTDPLQIPLNAPPGKPPLLDSKWGSISISHCNDMLLIGWSREKIGVDIERNDRSFSYKQLAKRLYSKQAQKRLCKLNIKEIKDTLLEDWVIKEASIKYHHGSIFKDLCHWEWDKKLNIAEHKLLNFTVNTRLIKYESWIIGLASNQQREANLTIICRY